MGRKKLASSARSVQYWSFIFSIFSLGGKICKAISQNNKLYSHVEKDRLKEAWIIFYSNYQKRSKIHSNSTAQGKDAGNNILEKGHWVINSTEWEDKELVFRRKGTQIYCQTISSIIKSLPYKSCGRKLQAV